MVRCTRRTDHPARRPLLNRAQHRPCPSNRTAGDHSHQAHGLLQQDRVHLPVTQISKRATPRAVPYRRIGRVRLLARRMPTRTGGTHLPRPGLIAREGTKDKGMRGPGADSTTAESTSFAVRTTDTKSTVLADQTPLQLVVVVAGGLGSDITGVAVIDRRREWEGEPVRTTA